MKHLIPVVLLFTSILHSCIDKKVADLEKYKIFTTAKEISSFYNIPLDTSGLHENVRLRKFINGTIDLKYQYDLKESSDFSPLFYSIRIEIEPNENEAVNTFTLTKTILLATNSATGREVIVIDSLALPGDQNFYAVRTKDNEPNGVFLLIRENNRIYTLTMSGLYSSDNSLIVDLILPKIENLGTFPLNKD
jgi:hypothetical protein